VVVLNANPLVRHRFIRAVAVAAGRASPEAEADDDAAAITPLKAPTVDEAHARGQLVLVAEDNATNQDVIRRQLGVLGYACEITGNGVQALEAWKTGRYALLLTDCHMPEMDGYELAGAIRRMESGTARHGPIVAITANALQGEAERCLAAGMDDYLTKPLAMAALQATLRKWLPESVGEPYRDASTSDLHLVAFTATGDGPVNDRAIKDMFGDDEATFKEVLDSFVGPSEEIVAAILAALDSRDASAVKGAAHKLKSSARTVGADELADTCAALESAGKMADWASIDSLAPRAEMQFKGVLEYIRAL